MQILERVPPSGLLNVSRTSKDIRSLLLHRSAEFVWRASFSTVEGLPVCPTNLSLPAWANLIYGRTCHVS